MSEPTPEMIEAGVRAAVNFARRNAGRATDPGWEGYVIDIYLAMQAAGRGGWQLIDDEAKRLDEVLAYSVHGGTGTMLIRWGSLIDFLSDGEIEELARDGMDDESLEDPGWYFADFAHGGRLGSDCYPTHYMPVPQPSADRSASEATPRAIAEPHQHKDQDND